MADQIVDAVSGISLESCYDFRVHIHSYRYVRVAKNLHRNPRRDLLCLQKGGARVTEVMESSLWQVRSVEEAVELMGEHRSVKWLTIASSENKIPGVPTRTAEFTFILLPAFVIPELWDPLESTCRHASLSIL